MKKIILLVAVILLPSLTMGGEIKKEIKDPMKDRKLEIRRPDADKIILSVSAKLKLSSKQEERIGSAIKKQAREFDNIFENYQDAEEKEKKWRFEMNEFRYEMFKISTGITDLIREFLDKEQRETLDKMIEARMTPKKAKRKVKKRRRVKSKKTIKPLKRRGQAAPKPVLEKKIKAKSELLDEEDPDIGYYP